MNGNFYIRYKYEEQKVWNYWQTYYYKSRPIQFFSLFNSSNFQKPINTLKACRTVVANIMWKASVRDHATKLKIQIFEFNGDCLEHNIIPVLNLRLKRTEKYNMCRLQTIVCDDEYYYVEK